MLVVPVRNRQLTVRLRTPETNMYKYATELAVKGCSQATEARFASRLFSDAENLRRPTFFQQNID